MTFAPILTDRLRIRAPVPGDAQQLHERRNDPLVAKYQDWTVPYPLERATAIAEGSATMGGPRNDEWWMAVVEEHGGGTVGDLAVHLSWDCRGAEIGFTVAPDHWGRGYATEAAAAMIEYLFATFPLTRIHGQLHPDNPASAMVLERLGFQFEGHTRNSFWVGDENSDDWIYGLTRDDWDTWTTRSRKPPGEVRLVEIDPYSISAVSRLRTHRSQESFVSPMADTFADALFPEIYRGAPMVPWMRAVEADGEIVAFAMVALVTDAHPEPYLWRLLVDRLHQRRGIGRRILDLVVEEVRTMGATTLITSWAEGKGSPEPFYRAYGFEPTGEIEDDEVVARLMLG